MVLAGTARKEVSSGWPGGRLGSWRRPSLRAVAQRSTQVPRIAHQGYGGDGLERLAQPPQPLDDGGAR